MWTGKKSPPSKRNDADNWQWNQQEQQLPTTLKQRRPNATQGVLQSSLQPTFSNTEVQTPGVPVCSQQFSILTWASRQEEGDCNISHFIHIGGDFCATSKLPMQPWTELSLAAPGLKWPLCAINPWNVAMLIRNWDVLIHLATAVKTVGWAVVWKASFHHRIRTAQEKREVSSPQCIQ